MNVNIECVLYNLEQIECSNKPLEAKGELKKRLEELAEGRKITLVAFNCLDFSWIQQQRNLYPQSLVSADSKFSICRYYQDYIGVAGLELAELGKPTLNIIVPDSELLDERVFSFAQSRQERIDLAAASRVALAAELIALDNPNSPVMLWSEYCQQQNLKSPLEYTAENYLRIQSEPKLQKKVRDQAKDSKKYFERNNIDVSRVEDSEFIDRTAWYLAMYMGEGQALSESRAICLNLEDNRVPAWFQRGANGLLPILNPADPNEFYAWRAKIAGGSKM